MMFTTALIALVALVWKGSHAVPDGLKLCSPGISAVCTITPHVILMDHSDLKEVLSCTGFDTGLLSGMTVSMAPPSSATGSFAGFQGHGGCSDDAPAGCSTQEVTLFPDLVLNLCYASDGASFGDANGYVQAVLDVADPSCDAPLKELYYALDKGSTEEYTAILDANPSCKELFEIVAAPTGAVINAFRDYIQQVHDTCMDTSFKTCEDADKAARTIIAEPSAPPGDGNAPIGAALPPGATTGMYAPPAAAASLTPGGSSPGGGPLSPSGITPGSDDATSTLTTPPPSSVSGAAFVEVALAAWGVLLGMLWALHS